MKVEGWIERKSVKLPNTRLELLDYGVGRPLLMLHSGVSPTWPSSAYLEELSKTFRVIAPWHPGFGQSELPPGFKDVSDLAYTYLDLMEYLDLRDVTLVGASFGGWLAAEVAVRSCERLAALVLAAPYGIKVGDRNSRDILDFYAVPPADWPSLTFFESEKWRPDYASLPESLLVEIARGRESLALLGWSPFMHNPRLRDWLHRIRVPARILWGRQDKIIGQQYASAFADRVRDAQLEIVEGAGHYPHLEKPAEFAASVRSLVSQDVIAA
jgi:pimeloyl-ACP methyl ester carboxylesterase